MSGRPFLLNRKEKVREMRLFPRFPLNSFFIFKASDGHSFEVKNISYQGMQLFSKQEQTYPKNQALSGVIQWRRASLNIEGTIQWVKGGHFGMIFKESLEKKIRTFLGVKNIVSSMRLISREEFHLEFPQNLKYWIRSDVPVEIFIWTHNNGEISRFHILFFGFFVEYEVGRGVLSGQVTHKKDIDSPLIQENEYALEIDRDLDSEKMRLAKDIMVAMPEGLLSKEVHEFLCLKLSITN